MYEINEMKTNEAIAEMRAEAFIPEFMEKFQSNVKRNCYLNAAEILKLDPEHQLAYFNHLTKVSLYDTMLEYAGTSHQDDISWILEKRNYELALIIIKEVWGF